MKQTLRRGLSALLALVLVLGALPAGAAASLDGAETSAVILEEEPTTPAEETATGDTENTAESEAAEPEPDTRESAEDDVDFGEPTGENADSGESAEDDADTGELAGEDAVPAEADEAADSAGESQEEPEEEAAVNEAAAEEEGSAEEDVTEGEESAEEAVTEDEEAAEEPAEDEAEGEVEVAAASVTRTAAYKRSYAKKGTTYRILVIGNSYSVDSTQYLYRVAHDAGYKVVVGNLQRGGQTLANHWSYAKNDSAVYTYRKNTTGSWKTIRSNSATMTQAVEDEDWDIIIFQQYSTDSGLSSSFYTDQGSNYLTLLSNYVTKLCSNSKVKIGFEMTWAHKSDSTNSVYLNKFSGDQLTMYKRICSTTKSAVAASGAVDLIITAGTAIQNARSSYLGDTLNRDAKHLSYGLGRYLAAMSMASACGMDLSGITKIRTGSYTYSSLHLAVLKQAVSDAETAHYAVTDQSTKKPSLSRPTVTKSTSSGKTTLTWSAVSGATGYQVYRLSRSGGTAALLTTLDAGKSSYSYSYTATGYYYYVCALGDDYISDKVDASAKVTSSPSISSLKNTSGSTLTVKWSGVSSITGYQVQTATNSSFTKNVQTTTSSGASKTTSSCTSGKKYYVRVRAYRTVGDTRSYSAWSSVKNIYCVGTPTLSSVSNASSSKLTVKWSAVSSVTGYQVQTATDSSFTKNVKTYTVSGASKTASNYTNGKKYYVRVRAYKTVSGTKHYSAWSGKKSTYCLSAPSISSLKNVKIRKMTVKWGKNSKATGYQIQYSTSSSFSSYKTVTVTSYKTVSKTISKLTKKKKYYVRVRVYKTVSGTNYCSAWSGNKSVKISK